MKKHISSENMNDRELRAYRRAYRRRKALVRKACFYISIFVIVLVTSISLSSISKANSSDDTPKFKYYKQIEVQHNETLWEIAKQNIDTEKYSDMNAYIEEVCSINHLEEDQITTGQTLIIPYYSQLYY